ncbi:hypothetical protein MXB_2417 [Myxobolus squamalis]|nr:hypothetical protein MXB_2417 [Myxobolus squamalis]
MLSLEDRYAHAVDSSIVMADSSDLNVSQENTDIYLEPHDILRKIEEIEQNIWKLSKIQETDAFLANLLSDSELIYFEK